MTGEAGERVRLRTPCVECGTRKGYVVNGRKSPFRGRGMCYSCYKLWHEKETEDDSVAGFDTDPHVGWPFGRIPPGGDPADDPEYKAACKAVRDEHFRLMALWQPTDHYLLKQQRKQVSPVELIHRKFRGLRRKP